jgi:hypothetical protein
VTVLLLIYRPEGADERRWTFQPEKLLSSEAEAIEKSTGMTYQEFGQALIKGSAAARRALLWVYLKREDAPLRFNQVDVPVGAISLDYEAHELVAIRDALKDDTTLTDEERDSAIAGIQELIDEAPEDEAPKAPANVVDLSA